VGQKFETLAAKIMYAIESHMEGCAFTFGLVKPNLTGKSVLEYTTVLTDESNDEAMPDDINEDPFNPFGYGDVWAFSLF
jgi:hypothetical protein